jgi:glycosyltransferase involved in cell wall biosynthesis
VPRISVIVPNYNHAKYLKQRIDSILEQSYKDFELILLDDCSTDCSREIIEEYTSRNPDIKSYYNSINSGSPFKQWDFGVSKAVGEYIWIAESDDFAEPGFLKKALAVISANEKAGMVYCDARMVNEIKSIIYLSSESKSVLDKNKWCHDYTNEGKNEISDSLFLNNTITNISGTLIRRKTYEEAGYADHSMIYCGDWFLYLRILLITDVAYIAKPLNSVRLHNGSSFNEYYKKSTYSKEVLKIYLFVLKNFNLPVKKKFEMAKNLLRIAAKRIVNRLN